MTAEQIMVAPFAGAWIEIKMVNDYGAIPEVAPFAGAWIEMSSSSSLTVIVCVAPFAGAWIEMCCYDWTWI